MLLKLLLKNQQASGFTIKHCNNVLDNSIEKNGLIEYYNNETQSIPPECDYGFKIMFVVPGESTIVILFDISQPVIAIAKGIGYEWKGWSYIKY